MDTQEQKRNYWLGRISHALRNTTTHQIYGRLANGGGGRCAVGVFFDALIADGIMAEDWASHRSVQEDDDTPLPRTYKPIHDLLFNNLMQIAEWNDERQMTFLEIADRLDEMHEVEIEAEIAESAQPELVSV